MQKTLLLFMMGLMLFTGCKSYEKVIYLQQSGQPAVFAADEQYPIPEPLIKPGDVLMITVNSNTPEAAMAFNLPLVPSGTSASYSVNSGSVLSYGMGLQNYLVDMKGYLLYPVIGKIKVSGLTKDQLSAKIKSAIYPQFLVEEPIVLIRYGSFKVSVVGEVLRPGTYSVDNEKINILQALALAGDMTIYGNRSNILLVRENGDKRESVRIDLTNKDLLNSPWFYLQQNDVLYVEPNTARSRASGIGIAETLSISVIGTLISLSTLVINILKN